MYVLHEYTSNIINIDNITTLQSMSQINYSYTKQTTLNNSYNNVINTNNTLKYTNIHSHYIKIDIFLHNYQHDIININLTLYSSL